MCDALRRVSAVTAPVIAPALPAAEVRLLIARPQLTRLQDKATNVVTESAVSQAPPAVDEPAHVEPETPRKANTKRKSKATRTPAGDDATAATPRAAVAEASTEPEAEAAAVEQDEPVQTPAKSAKKGKNTDGSVKRTPVSVRKSTHGGPAAPTPKSAAKRAKHD